jgi:GNAT superfamily N-acetyltransferase
MLSPASASSNKSALNGVIVPCTGAPAATPPNQVLNCDRQEFATQVNDPVLLPVEHPLRRSYGAEVPAVYAIIRGDQVVSHAHIKPPGSGAVWEIAVGTDPEHRGKGYATAVVSATTQSILAAGRVALFACEEGNHPSLAVARDLGHAEYGRDLLRSDTYPSHRHLPSTSASLLP